MKLTRVQQIVIGPDAVVTILIYREGPGVWVAVREQPVASINKWGLPFPIQQGSIGGKAAAFFSQTLQSQAQASQLTIAAGIFEAGDLLVEISGPNLSITDIAQTGASLA